MTRYSLVLMLIVAATFGCSNKDDSNSEISYIEKSESPVDRISKPLASDSINQPVLGSQSKIVQGYTNTHHNSEHGFSIHLPDGWAPIDKTSLWGQSEAVSGPNLKVEYIAGYQILENDLFDHPFILVQRMHNTALPRDKIQSVRRHFSRSKNEINAAVNKGTGLHDLGYQLDIDVGVPALEPDTGIVWLKSQLNGIKGQRIEVLSAHYYVDDYILQFNAGTTVARSEEDWPILERILRTITLDGNDNKNSEVK